MNNEDSVTDELKDLLSRKPVFLPRLVIFLCLSFEDCQYDSEY